MKNHVYEKLDMSEPVLDEFDRFEFEEQDDLREFLEDSDTVDLI